WCRRHVIADQLDADALLEERRVLERWSARAASIHEHVTRPVIGLRRGNALVALRHPDQRIAKVIAERLAHEAVLRLEPDVLEACAELVGDDARDTVVEAALVLGREWQVVRM